MEKSENINELLQALSKAQGQIEGAKKDSSNPYFKSKYADLASVWGVIRKPLSDNGLSIIQFPTSDGDMISVLSILGHSSGQWISETLSMKPLKEKKGEGLYVSDDPQTVGKTISYIRRYSLASIIGVFQEDDDGNSASKGQERPPKPKEEKTNNFEFLKAMSEIKKNITDEYGPSAYYTILDNMGFKHSNEITDRKSQVKVYQLLTNLVEDSKEEANAE